VSRGRWRLEEIAAVALVGVIFALVGIVQLADWLERLVR
jgi:hypothetical protein